MTKYLDGTPQVAVAKGICSICGFLVADLKAIRDSNGERIWICRVTCPE